MAEAKHTLFTCITCDPRGEIKDGSALGNQMHETVKAAVASDTQLCDKVDVQKVTCMGGCEQPCTVAFAAPGKITWVFTHQHPDKVSDVIDTAKVYIGRPNGQMVRDERAPNLQKNVFCKIPAVK